MNIQNAETYQEGIFFIDEGNERLATMYYRWRGEDRIIIEHTEVSDKLKGKGIGKQLVDHAVAFAREKHIKIIPLCPFAKSVFEKYKGYEDVL
ncbi:MAG: N-acetyltransferase [Sporocytophaga sp.]|uniref:GNAT family N-acetyltransferase n=1 Tax=Sporocytophaga sp. TaxID=2231183 RepID=UPI001B27C06A|nr:GNAT family N-acetyltransferase [Sporocytophaga sp.]MBO9699569.1 N-acetyltransferase [Sporocytophaga sp.]